MGELVRVEIGDGSDGSPAGVATIRLDRPPMNAINSQVQEELRAAAAQVSADDSIRAVVIYGGERVFAAGADVKEFSGQSHAEVMRDAPRVQSSIDSLAQIPKPVIAAITGYALGGGCELALSCDLVVADESAVLGLPEVTIGLVPGGGGTQLALRRLGPGRAADVVLTGRRIPAEEARDLGLVDAANSPVATRAAKRALRSGWGLDYRAAMDVEDAAWRTAAFSADRKEGIAAFNEKRTPDWPGI